MKISDFHQGAIGVSLVSSQGHINYLGNADVKLQCSNAQLAHGHACLFLVETWS